MQGTRHININIENASTVHAEKCYNKSNNCGIDLNGEAMTSVHSKAVPMPEEACVHGMSHMLVLSVCRGTYTCFKSCSAIGHIHKYVSI